MDEPFGALDVQTKAIMQTELLGLWEQLRPSVLFITHDLDEAVALADRVLVMTSSPGSIKESFDIDLPRPRGEVQEIRHEPRFLELQGQIWASLKDEVERAYAADGGCGMTAHERDPGAVRDRGDARRTSRSRRSALAPTPALVVLARPGSASPSSSSAAGSWFTTEKLGRQVLLRPAVRDLAQRWSTLFTQGHRIRLDLGRTSGVTLKEARLRLPARHRRRRSSSACCSGRTASSPTSSGPYIKIVNAIPRIILGSIFIVAFGLGTLPEGPARRRAGVLHRVLQRLPGRPRGRPEPGRQRPGARRLTAAGRPARDDPLGADLDHRQPAHRVRLRHHRRPRRRGARSTARHRPDHQPGAGQLRPEHRLRLHGDHGRRHPRRRVPHHASWRSASCPGARRRRRRPPAI